MAQALITINAVTGSNPPNGTALVIDTVVALDKDTQRFLDRAQLPHTYVALKCLEHICTEEAQLRFWSYVDRNADAECWIWRGDRSRFGHGRFLFLGNRTQAHRYAYELTHGPLSDAAILCHKCDVPGCVNPSHMFVGTQKDNIQDSVRKGRWPTGRAHWCSRMPELVRRGERAGSSKLSEDQVAEIYRLCCAGSSYTSVAALFGINNTTAAQIHKGKTWNHVTGAPRWRAHSS